MEIDFCIFTTSGFTVWAPAALLHVIVSQTHKADNRPLGFSANAGKTSMRKCTILIKNNNNDT